MDKNHEYKKSTIISKNSDKPKANEDRHYVDKKTFYEALVLRSKEVQEAEDADEDKPQASDFIGQCIIDICTNLAKKHQFSGYHFKDEMVADAICHCIRYIDSFDIEKSDNPFSYFTQAAYFQFIKRINLEKEQLYIKCKSTMSSIIHADSLEEDVAADNAEFMHDNMELDTEFAESFITDYEHKVKVKKAKAKETKMLKKKSQETKYGLDLLIDEE